VTAQGHPRAIFKRAIEHGNVTVAEMTARELGGITLAESLALTALVVQKDPSRRSRYTVRWLLRLLEEDENLTSRRRRWPRRLWPRSAAGATRRRSRRYRPWPNVGLGSRVGGG
jgi:hypothetical protein